MCIRDRISHLKAMGRDSWGKKIPQVLELLEEARQEGLDVGCDVYPYTAGSTQLLYILPPEFLAGGMEAVVRRLSDPAARRELVRSAHSVTAATHEKNGPADLVTEYDLAVQRFLRQELLALLPEADFFGEEGQHDTLTSPWTFIVDPIDGTTNFVRGFAYTNISVALAKDGQVEYAVVYAPLAGELYAARRGGGATLNGRAIHVSGRDPGHSLVVCGSTIYDRSYTERHFAIMRYLYDRGLDYRRFGAAALDLCQVSAGRAEVFFECRLSPWDFAAGSLLVQEAGGCVTTLEGTTIDPLRPGSVFAANALCGGLTAELPRG